MEQKINIVYLITGLGVGGAEANLRELAALLDSGKFRVTVVSILPLGHTGQEMIKKGIRVISLNIKNRFDIRMVTRLYRLLKSERPDVLHTQLFHADILGRIIGRILRIPIIISTLQNMTFGGRVREKILALTKMFVTYHVAVSKLVLENAIKLNIVDSKKSTVIYNAAPNMTDRLVGNKKTLRETMGLPQDRKIIVATGRLIPQKGFLDLIRAVRILESSRTEPFVVYILGEGFERPVLEQEIKTSGVSSIVLAGVVHNVYDYLYAADGFVLSSHWEGAPVALMEAAHAKLPIVSTCVGITPEFIHEGINGFQISVGDVDGLAQKIAHILDLTDHQSQEMGTAVYNDAKKMFSIDRMVTSYERLYREQFESWYKNNKHVTVNHKK